MVSTTNVSTDNAGGESAATLQGVSATTPAAPAPSLTENIIEASDGLGGTNSILIQNISSEVNLGIRLDLKKIASKCRNTDFNPRRCGALVMRLREPRATALIFPSGRLCVTGTDSPHRAEFAAKKFAHILERVGFPPAYVDSKIQSIRAMADVGFPIRLEGLLYAHSAFASYEPELFPGLVYRLVNPRVVVLIFVSGKIVFTRAKTEGDLTQAYAKLYPVLLEYRNVDVASLPGLSDTTATQPFSGDGSESGAAAGTQPGVGS